ncbi:LOW QUALITY PROTEIN: uncharacterized protein C1orf167 homolog [Moschus berezovskii]|uniref:LOW QUALITY PROTEIN: uncharacterized protein C1orf167 homolog n=1 Tax=Moschus berezovskii TaxID=68408 RepID=UPI0024439BD9|nr:LOW QUALITY PROTEIN: uncharacterized protein C1orf167 homolog [Moschus berezovskii]
MELRPDASHKENVPPRPATSLRPEPRRLRKSLGVGLASRHGQWVPVGLAERGGPAATPCPGTALRQEPCQVQSNLASPSPSPSLGLVLRDTTSRLTNSSFRQQDNLQLLVGRPQGRAQDFAIQQSNLCTRETYTAECGRLTSPQLWSEPQKSFWPHLMPQGSPLPRGPLARPSSNLRQSWLLATDTSCPDIRLTTRLAPLKGPTWSDPRSRYGLGDWTSRLVGEPLTLKDLAVPAQSQPQAPSQAAIHQLLVCVQHLECQAVRLRCQASQELPGPMRQKPWTRAGQTLLVRPQPSQPVLDSWDERRRHSRGLRGTTSFPETRGAQEGLSNSQASSKHTSLRTTLEVVPGDALDPEHVVFSVCPLKQGEQCSPETTHSWGQKWDLLLPPEADSREGRLCSSASSSSARGILPGQEGGDRIPKERISREKERPASRLPDTAPARSALQNKARNTVNLEPELGRWQWLSRCFRAWWRWVQQRRAVAAAVALGRRQLLRRGLRALRWALWLREAQLEAAWGRHTQALLARTFQKWRHLIQQHKQGQPHVQAGPRPLSSGGDQDQGPSGRKPVVDDGGDRGVPILQALQHLAVFLLWCHQKEWVRQENGVQGEASQATLRTQRMGRPPHAWRSPAAGAAWVALLDPQHRRAWLCRCFGAWQRFVQRGTRYRDHVANRQAGTLRTCLRQWVQMKQLRASDGAKVAQLSLCWQKTGNMALFSSVPGGATARGLRLMAAARMLPQEQGQGSLQEACRKLALQRVLLLWRTRLSQRQQADSFFEGVQRQALRHILSGWRLRARDLGRARIASAPDPLGSALGGETPPGRSTHRRSSQDKVSRAPALLEMLQLSFLWAAGQRQQGQYLLIWRARAQQSRDAARWHQSMLQRRILLDWSHWATAQGARRELAARWAWDRRGRAALGLWRQLLVQRREVERQARERGRRLQRRALGHWHCYWQRPRLEAGMSIQRNLSISLPTGQVFLQEKCQRWMQARLQGLQRAMFWGWQQAAAHRRPVAASPEQLLLQSHFQAWRGVVKASWAKHPAFQDGLRRRIPGATFANEAPVATAQPQELPVARASCWRSREQGCQADRQLRRTWAQQAFVARRVAPGQCCKSRWQAGEHSRAQALCWMLWARECCQHRVIQDHAVPTLSTRVQETWTQSATQGHVQRTAVTHFQQAGPRRFLRTHWAQWRTALFRVWLEPQAEVQAASRAHPARPRASLWHWPGLATRGRLLVLMKPPTLKRQVTASLPPAPPPSPSCRGPGVPAGPQASALRGQEGTAALKPEISRARKGIWAAPAAEFPASQAPGSHVAVLGRCSGGGEHISDDISLSHPTSPEPGLLAWSRGKGPSSLRAAGGERQQRDWGLPGTAVGPAQGVLATVLTVQAVAPEMGLETVAVACPAVASGSAVTESGGQPGPFPGTGGRPHLQQALPNRATPAHSQAAPSLAAVPRASPFSGREPRFPGHKSHAFKKWHQCLAARGLRARASSSKRPWSKPGSRPEAARAPALAGPGAEKGAQLQLCLVLMERTDRSSTHLRSTGSGHRAPRPGALKDNKTPSLTPAASLSLLKGCSVDTRPTSCA